MVQQLDNLCPKPWSFEGVHEFWYHSLIVHLNSNFLVKTEVEKHPQGDLQQKSVVAWDEAVQFLDYSQLFHLVLVLSENRQLLEEVENYEKKVGIVALKHGHQKGDDLSILHFALNLEVFGQIEQQVECDEEHLLLLFDNHGELLFVFSQLFGGLFIHFTAFHLLQLDCLLLEFADSDYISFNLVIDDFDGRVTNLIGEQEFMELSEVAVSLEDVEQIECELNSFLIIISQCTRHRTK